MRKIINISTVILLSIFAVSCDSDSSIETIEPLLKIVESDITFETTGGSGYIIVEAPGVVTATSNEEWLKIDNVSGTTISISAEPNIEMAGRTATITIKSNSEITEVTAVQVAAVMWFKDFTSSTLAFLSEGSTLKTAVSTSYPIEIVDKPDWITFTLQNDSVFLTASASSPRKGSITFSSQDRTISYDIMQVSYAGFLGEWEMEFNNPSASNRLETATVIFEENVYNSSFWLRNLIITGSNEAIIHVDFNPTTNDVTISAGQYLMTATDGRLVILSLRSDRGTYVYGTGSQLGGTLDIAEDGTVTYTFAQNGTWPDANGIGFYLFTGTLDNLGTTGSSYRRFMNVKMKKL